MVAGEQRGPMGVGLTFGRGGGADGEDPAALRSCAAFATPGPPRRRRTGKVLLVQSGAGRPTLRWAAQLGGRCRTGTADAALGRSGGAAGAALGRSAREVVGAKGEIGC